MTKTFASILAAVFAFGLSAAHAQNVKSDQEKAQKQEQQMQDKEKGATGAGQQGGPGDRDGAKSDDGRAAPSAGGPSSPDKAQTAMKCDGLSGSDREECLEHASGKPGDEDDAGAGKHNEGGDKYKK